MEDILQVCLNKKTHRLVNYGDIQIGEDGFNMGFTIDGTRDSCKIKVFNYIAEPIEPYSIAYHPTTKTWWVVSSDKVDRYYHEGSYLYIHTLQLEGAIELLNARDLTDCGYYQNQYTIGKFLERLFALSNFEYEMGFNVNTNNIDLDKKVDYLKTFENYTLGSAIREFLNGYNCSGKLTFNTENNVITSSILHIIPRTGDLDKATISIDAFNEVRENQEMKKQNFATSVISNAENVVSTQAKTYPTLGTIRLKTNDNFLLDVGGVNSSGSIVKGNAKLLLPSPAYKVNWVKMFIPVSFLISLGYATSGGTSYYTVDWLSLDPNDFITALRTAVTSNFVGNTRTIFLDYINEHEEELKTQAILRRTITFYGGAKVLPYLGTGSLPTANIVPPTNNDKFYVPRFTNSDNTDANNTILVDEETYNALHSTRDGIMWKRGSNEITSFGGIGYKQRGIIQQYSYLSDFSKTDYGRNDYYLARWTHYIGATNYEFGIVCGYKTTDGVYKDVKIDYHKVQFKVNYIPMSDIKIKQDNRQESRDIKLYNQNGKLTDSNAFSKQLLSYAKEVETKTITRFGVYNYPISSLPKIGQRVYDKENDQYYVIENISYDIYANEGGYFVSGTFELAPNVAVKSLMVNPNSNIRDYGIPQSNNVVRKQLYRDFYEIDTIQEETDKTWYLPITSIVNFDISLKQPKEHTALMKITFDDDKDYYYQLDTTTYVMKKSIYEVVDFKDNNIIGYDCQTKERAFDITKLLNFDTWVDINTPISYVDDNGKFTSVEIKMVDDNDLANAYNTYLQNNGYDPIQYNVYHTPVYIPKELYDLAQEDYSITEANYKKDPLEVPFFEYCCQIDDGDNVKIGEDLLSILPTDKCYGYGYSIVDKGQATLLNANNFITGSSIENGIAEIDDYAKVSFVYKDYVESISSFRLDNNVIVTNWYNLPTNAINVGASGLAIVQYRINNTQWRFADMNIEYDSTNNRVRFVSDTITLPSGVFTIDFRGSVSYKYNFANDFNISIKLYGTSQIDVANVTETLGTLHTEYNLSNFENKSLIIYKYRFNEDLETYSYEPIFIIENLTEDNIVKTLLNTFDYIKLYVNYYKS